METLGVDFLVEIVAFLRDVTVVLRFTVTFVDATGFLDVTLAVAFFDGLNVVPGRRVGLTSPADVRLKACVEIVFLVVVEMGLFVLDNVLDGGCFVVILIVVAGGEVERFAGRFES